ncbi:MAG: hypothetical protein H7255_13015 [Ramlibacter sp.]|nr:hypothetical protein [Ramlibacter sp.]
MRAEDQQRLAEVDLELMFPQESFALAAASTDSSSAGGLIDALLSASVQRNQQNSLNAERAFLDAMLDVDLREDARAELSSRLETLPMKFRSLTATALVPTREELDSRIAATKDGHAYMQLAMSYTFDNDLKVLTTRASAKLWQDGSRSRTYESTLVYQGALRDDTGRRIEALNRQTATQVQFRMREAVRETVRMIAADLQHPDGRVVGPMAIRILASGIEGRKIKGEIIESQGLRPLLRDVKSVLFSLER